MDAGSQRKLFFKNLDGALWYEDDEGDNGTFAGDGTLLKIPSWNPCMWKEQVNCSSRFLQKIL